MANQLTIAQIGDMGADAALSDELARCWMDVANDGGPVGFAFIPVDIAQVRDAVQRLATEIDRGRATVLGARISGELVGWVSLTFNTSPLAAHWGKIQHLQSHPTQRGQGIGAALLNGAVDHATALGLEQLILFVRGGEQLEPFYERHGWHEIGRHVDALRFADDDDRDEVMMRIKLG